MKKVLLVLIFLMWTTGCDKTDVMQKTYNKQMNKLFSVNENSEYIPCDIEITYAKITEEEVSYQIVFDNPKENMRNINIVVSHDMKTDDGYPSIGVFDEESINLSTIVDIDNPNKGIVLVGYFNYSGEIEDLDAKFKISLKYIANCKF